MIQLVIIQQFNKSVDDNSTDNNAIDNSIDNIVIDNSTDDKVIDNSADDNSVDNNVNDNTVDDSSTSAYEDHDTEKLVKLGKESTETKSLQLLL